MQSVNQFLQDLSLNARADLDDVDGSTTSLAARVAALESATLSIKYATTDYTILDDDGYDIVMVDSRGGNVTITLPTLAANQSRQITVIAQYLGGQITVDGEGAETIDGIAASVLQSKDDFVTVLGTTTEWKILSCKQSIDTGWINNSDLTNRILGMSKITYDGASGTLIIGEVLTEATSNNTWILVAQDATTLWCKNATGTGVATNDRVITGATSAATVVVNGNSINANADLIHNFGRGVMDLRWEFAFNDSAYDTNCFNAKIAFHSSGSEVGEIAQQIDTNTIRFQTGAYSAFIYFNTSGSWVGYTTNGYHKIRVSYIK
jgi:hypothetical protein